MKPKYLSLALLLIVSVAFACAGPSYHGRPHHTRLSKAMEKASDKHQGDRRIETEAPRPHDVSHLRVLPPIIGNHELYYPRQESASIDSSNEEKKPVVYGLSAGYGLIKGDDIYQLNQFDLSVGACLDEKQRLEGFIGFGYPLINESTELNASVDDVWLMNIGLRYKLFTTPRHTFLGHYFTFGLSYAWLSWDYENAIQFDDQLIRGDSLEGLEFFAGMGLNLAQTENLQFGLEALPSVTFWYTETEKGFDNDVFDPFYTLKIRLTLSFF